MKIYLETRVNKNYLEVIKGFDLSLFKALKPPMTYLEVQRFDGCLEGDEVHLIVGPLKQKWISYISQDFKDDSKVGFVDIGKVLPPPLKTWEHKHVIQKIDNKSSIVIDDIEFSSGSIFINLIIYLPLYIQFALRKPIYKKYFNGVQDHV